MSKKIERTLPVSAAVTIVNGLLDAVHKDITIKTFVNKNLNSFTIVKLGQVFETALLPFDCHPRNEKFSEEQEAQGLLADNYMPTDKIQRTGQVSRQKPPVRLQKKITLVQRQKQSQKSRRKNYDSRQSRGSEVLMLVQSAKKDEVESLITKNLRLHKASEENAKREQGKELKNKVPLQIIKQKNIGFDYEGKHIKYVQKQRDNLVNAEVGSSVQEEITIGPMQRKIINSSVVPYIYKIEDKEGETKKSSMAKRKEGEKLKDIHLNANMKEDIIKATEVKQKGIKITMEEKVLKAKSDYAADDFSLKAKGDRKVTKMQYQRIRSHASLASQASVLTLNSNNTNQKNETLPKINYPSFPGQHPQIAHKFRSVTETNNHKARKTKSIIHISNQIERLQLIKNAEEGILQQSPVQQKLMMDQTNPRPESKIFKSLHTNHKSLLVQSETQHNLLPMIGTGRKQGRLQQRYHDRLIKLQPS